MAPADSVPGDSHRLTMASRGQRTGECWGLLVLFTRLHLQGLIAPEGPHPSATALMVRLVGNTGAAGVCLQAVLTRAGLSLVCAGRRLTVAVSLLFAER